MPPPPPGFPAHLLFGSFVGGGGGGGGRGGRHGHGFGGPQSGLPSSLVALREAVAGMQRTGLPPQLLFSDRDFTADDYDMLCRLDETVENRRGATAAQLAALPTQTAPAGGLLSEGGERLACSICLEVGRAARGSSSFALSPGRKHRRPARNRLLDRVAGGGPLALLTLSACSPPHPTRNLGRGSS
jgi:hypothetical protein